MKTYLYPSPDQLQVLCDWANEGPSVLADSAGSRTPNNQDMTRTNNIRKLRLLCERVQIDDGVERLLQPVHRRPIENLDPVLMRHLTDACRFYGYLHWPDRGDRLAVTPLSGRELHALRLVASGMSSEEAGVAMDIGRHQIARILTKAGQKAGTRSPVHLAASAYRLGWLPLPHEMKTITESFSIGAVPPGFLVQDRNPW